MDFYCIKFVPEFFIDEKWKRERPRAERIIVIASNLSEAENKIYEYINAFNERYEYEKRYRTTSKVHKINGLHIYSNFNGGISCCSI